MPFVTEPFQAYLAASLDHCDVALPLSNDAYTDLMHLLSTKGTYTYLSIKDDAHFETVKAFVENNCLMIERGQAGTAPMKFSYGACVSTISPTVMAAVHSLFNDELLDCKYYYNPNAMGGTLDVAFTDLPQATHGVAWRGMVVLGGTLPIAIEVKEAPTWLTIAQHDNMIELTGTPPTVGSYTFTVSAASVQESLNINQRFSIVVR